MNTIPAHLDILSLYPVVKSATDSFLGVGICQESEDGDVELVPALCVTSDDELWEFTNAMSYGGGGSLCGAGAPPKWMFEWRVVRVLPKGSYELLKALPDAIETERQRRITAKRGYAWLTQRVRTIALDFVDEHEDVADQVFRDGWSAVLMAV